MTDALAAVPLWVIALVKSAIVLLVVITTFAYSMLFERKVMAWMQLRPGPNRVGPWGMLQPAADALKMMFKEDLTPNTADPLIYRLAPFISLICAMGTFAIIPFTGDVNGAWSIGNVNAGILFVFSLTSIGVYGISLAGLTVALDERLPAGVVALVAGVPSAPLNALRGALSVFVAAKRRPQALAEARG